MNRFKIQDWVWFLRLEHHFSALNERISRSVYRSSTDFVAQMSTKYLSGLRQLELGENPAFVCA